jgi:23S rRNA (uracil747-C5)-methyltransferase
MNAFRNRAKMTVTGTVDAPILGLPGEERLDDGRELLECPIHHPKLNALFAELPEFLRRFRIAPYQIDARRGELKGLIAFYSPKSREMYLRFVLRSQECVARLKKMVPELQALVPELVCISANLQPIPHAILEGPQEIFFTERTSILHQLGRIRLQLSPQAFVQTNVEMATHLYETAANWIAEIQPQRLMELYCGQGAFSFFAAASAQSILGVEIHPEAVRVANATAQEHGFTHLRFECADATQVEAQLRQFDPDVLLVNPPRRGLGAGVKLIESQRPKSWIYSSCESETLAEDLLQLSSLYRIRRAQIFDLFPHTEHFETLVWLERR